MEKEKVSPDSSTHIAAKRKKLKKRKEKDDYRYEHSKLKLKNQTQTEKKYQLRYKSNIYLKFTLSFFLKRT